MNRIYRLIAVMSLMVLTACESNMQIENTFNESYLANSSDLIVTSPNFSALHAPPLMSGLAYVQTYSKKEFCENEEPTRIGKVTITKANKTQYSKLPSGEIVALIVYHAVGANGGGLKGASFYSFGVKPDSKYKITITEARPLVTSYSVTISEITDSEMAVAPITKGKKNICSSS